uniref:Toll-like receptor 9 n=1 Tax=Andrias davidianus TaxID=141262 RepID=H9B0B4_ANDDA|nr:toll-like receptor 9 [Andrias davidianus]
MMIFSGNIRSLLKLAFVASAVQIVWATFPRFLPCDDSNDSTHVDCSHRKLEQIPAIKSNNVTELNLDKNKLVLIASNSFSGVPNLKSLNISWNCAPGKLRPDGEPCKLTIEKNAFSDLCYLNALHLAGNSLTVIPWLPSTLQLLNLESNNIVMLGYHNMSGVFKLKELYLGMNCYYQNPCNSSLTFSRDVFKDAKSLILLSLKFNNLNSIPLGLPSTLVSLDFSENKIPEIKSSDFDNLTSLEHLDLRWNCQRCDHSVQPCFSCLNNSALQIHPDAFRPLKNLKELNLRGNSLRNLSDSLVEPLTSLHILDLSDNLLAYAIANGTFFAKLPNVQDLSLNYNYKPLNTFPRLTLSPHLASMQLLRYISINGYFFKTLDEKGIEPLLSLPHLQIITFRTNFIQNVNLTIFSRIPYLRLLDLSENILALSETCKTSQDDTEALPLRLSEEIASPEFYSYTSDARSVTAIDEHKSFYFDFPSCRNYRKTLDLSFNNIKSIEPEDFRGLGDIECLNLSYNFINQRLNGNQFSYLRSLRLLDLAHNRFDLYYNKTLNELPNLEVLYLNCNTFQFMLHGLGHSFNFLQNMTSLTFLSLSYNTIGIRISKELRCPSLRVLVFRFNRLDIMWQAGKDTYLNIFTNLARLGVLDISYNKLQSIPANVLETLPKSLKKLYITHNKLRIFYWEKMSSLPSLEILDLSHNALNYLPNETVSFGSNFTFLSLESNHIISLNQVFFSNFSTLKYLILRDNKITLIDENSFSDVLLQNLQSLDVSGNPLSCTCEAHWFIQFLKSTKITTKHISNGMICDRPDAKRGQYLFSIDPRSCQDVYGHVGFIYTTFLVIFLTVLPLLKKLYGWDIWYGTYILKAALRKGYSSIPDTGGFDAFIVFDAQQYAVTDWVYNELVLHLEETRTTQFKLCLEERDWLAGKSRIENLCDAVYKSKKTIFVLAADGFDSGLLRHTFFMAQQRLMDEKLDVSILVLLDKGMKMSKYLLSRKRVCKKSILRWPCNPKAQPYFWHSLRVLLTHDSKHWYDNKLRKSIDG